MADVTTNPDIPNDPPTEEKMEKNMGKVPTLIIRLWPKIPVLYPMALVSLICGLLSWFHARDNGFALDNFQQVIALVFLASFTFSLFTLTFDIGFTWALLWMAAMVIIAMAMFIVNIYHPFLPDFLSFLTKLNPVANSKFYFCIFAVWAVLLALAYILTRFHYVKFEPNEIILVGGVLDKRRRYSTMRVTYTKEVVDVFEHYLPFIRSGRLVLRFPNEEEPLVLDNVMNIDKVIRKLETITSFMAVTPGQKSD
ncbi:MAG: hypothetical protein KA004_11410 [Verrucomicrobiales bacterium]|nr:hypothetical protein [Verrucomicrobiales bacterium]